MKQGRADVSGPADRKVEPRSKAINPGYADGIGQSYGNHATEAGTSNYKGPAESAGRGYSAPSIGQKSHPGGSQGKY